MLEPLNPRNSIEEKLTRQTEPYHYERRRSAIHSSYPRAAQPNTYQPNQIKLQGWGTTRDYWNTVFSDYLKRRKSSSEQTNLSLGRL